MSALPVYPNINSLDGPDMSKVVLKGHIVVPDSDLATVRAELPTHIELTREEEGCLVFEVVQNTDNPNVFDVYEEFIDRNAYESHQLRAQASAWGRVTANVKRYYEVTEVRQTGGRNV